MEGADINVADIGITRSSYGHAQTNTTVNHVDHPSSQRHKIKPKRPPSMSYAGNMY